MPLIDPCEDRIQDAREYAEERKWDEVDVGDEVCSKCGHPDIQIVSQLYACQTREYPAEYISETTCHNCGYVEVN